MELNSFQKNCRDELSKKFKIKNFNVFESDETRFAEKEVVIEASVKDLKLWIYEDGAHIKGPETNVFFEDLDYTDDDEMMLALMDSVSSLLEQK